MFRPYPQALSQIVDVRHLMVDDTFPRGSRPKRWYLVTASSQYPFLKGGHRYMFKEANPRSPTQFWAEVIASEIGRQCGIVVPPTFVSVDGERGVPGAFIEYFLHLPGGDPTERFTHAVDHLQSLQPDFDTTRGTTHNLATNLLLVTSLEKLFNLAGGLDFFARTLVFDALVGNTDRHQENWGFIWSDYTVKQRLRMAPVFDNGTSLGYEILEQKLSSYEGDRLDAYIRRGTHHMRLRLGEAKRSHLELCEIFGRMHPYTVPKMIGVVSSLKTGDLRRALEHLVMFDIPVRLSAARAEFILRATARRRELLGEAPSALKAQP